MRASPRFKLPWWPAVLLPLVFFGLGLAVLPETGLQDDEVLFATPIFHLPAATVFGVHIFHQQLPLMLLTYLGALKSWLYVPILMLVRPTYLTVRLPVLVIGSVTVGLFIWLLERVSGRTVAWVGGLLLATDTMFLFTTCFDWGPVALQHLLGVAGLALLFKFASEEARWALWLGFFCFGLALWDKALFAWFFTGLVVATVVVFPRELWSRCSVRNVGTAAAGLCLGALPLLAYNASSNLATFRGNSSFDVAQLPAGCMRCGSPGMARSCGATWFTRPGRPARRGIPERCWRGCPLECTRWPAFVITTSWSLLFG